MPKYTIDQFSCKTKNQEEQPLKDKKGRAYNMVGCKFKETGEWANMLSYDEKDVCRTWRVGAVVDVVLYESPGKNGKVFKNFKLPGQVDILEVRFDVLEERFNKMAKAVGDLMNGRTPEGPGDIGDGVV